MPINDRFPLAMLKEALVAALPPARRVFFEYVLFEGFNDAPGAQTAGGLAINTKHVKTEVLVENGGTVVIGGIYEQSERTDITKIPFFGDLPAVGWLFRNNTSTQSKTELLVFITPRIVNERLTIR